MRSTSAAANLGMVVPSGTRCSVYWLSLVTTGRMQ